MSLTCLVVSLLIRYSTNSLATNVVSQGNCTSTVWPWPIWEPTLKYCANITLDIYLHIALSLHRPATNHYTDLPPDLENKWVDKLTIWEWVLYLTFWSGRVTHILEGEAYGSPCTWSNFRLKILSKSKVNPANYMSLLFCLLGWSCPVIQIYIDSNKTEVTWRKKLKS